MPTMRTWLDDRTVKPPPLWHAAVGIAKWTALGVDADNAYTTVE
jgi:hypothetical protein